MGFIKTKIEELMQSDPISLLKELTNGLEPYLEYYSLLRFENLKEILSDFEKFPFFVIRGACGSGKSSFKTVLKNSFAENISVFEYNCSEITELDDIFFTFYKFMLQNPIKRELFRNVKSNFKPTSIDEQIMAYLKRSNGNIVLIFDNFEKLLSDTSDIKADNIKSFLQFLSTLKNIKVLLFAGAMNSQTLELPEEFVRTTRLDGLEENQIKDFLAIFKVDAPQSLHKEIYNETNGYIYSLKFLANSQKILNLPITAILRERAALGLSLNDFLAKKLISKLSAGTQKALYYLALFRHEINANILKNIDKFDNAQGEIDLLKDYMLIEGQTNFELRDFVKKLICNAITDRDKMKFHSKIADFYAEQIPLKPNERVIEISRTSMYSEKFYHYNIFSKLEKNFELQSSITAETPKKNEKKLDSETIKYIASTKYLPDLEIKNEEKETLTPTAENENKSKDIEPEENIVLSEEEKKLLGGTSEREEEFLTSEENTPIPEEPAFNEEFFEDSTEIKSEEETELQKAEKLLKKGVNYFQDGQTEESITYLKNAMSLLQNNDTENYYLAKLTLSRALIDIFKYDSASEYLHDLLTENTNNSIRMETLIELASIDEYEGRFEKALEKYNAALTMAKETDNKTYTSKIYFKTALLYDDTSETEKALYHYLLAATDATDTKDRTILASAYSNIASIYEEQGELNKAIEYYNKSMKEDEAASNYEGQAKSLSCLGNIFFSKNNINLAIKFFIKETQIAKMTDDNYLIASSYLELGDTFLSAQDYKNSLKAYFLAKKNIDSTISTDSKNKIERRFDMIVDEIGETAYNFLIKELRKR